MRETFLERQELALCGSVVAFWEDRDGSPHLEAAVHVVKQRVVAMALAHNGDVAPCRSDQPPLEFACNEVLGVGKEMHAGLDGKKQQQSELVEPVEVIADDDVIARLGDVLATLDLNAKAQPEEWDCDHADDSIRNVRAATDRKQVGRWQSCGGHRAGV